MLCSYQLCHTWKCQNHAYRPESRPLGMEQCLPYPFPHPQSALSWYNFFNGKILLSFCKVILKSHQNLCRGKYSVVQEKWDFWTTPALAGLLAVRAQSPEPGARSPEPRPCSASAWLFSSPSPGGSKSLSMKIPHLTNGNSSQMDLATVAVKHAGSGGFV